MATLFIILLLFSILGLIVGLIKPRFILRTDSIRLLKFGYRKAIALIFGFFIILFFVLIEITAEPLPKISTSDKSQSEVSGQPQTQQQVSSGEQEEPLQEAEVKEDNTFLVTRVIDGDTIEIEGGQRVRYIGIDTPETVDPRKPVQCFGVEASNRNKQLVDGKRVRLEKDVSETDKYGRLLRYVYQDNSFVNLVLVQDGYAYSYTYPPDVKYQNQFTEAQRIAREQNKGLWGSCQTTTTTTTPPATTTQTPTTPTAPIGNCDIKGNISSEGEKI